MQNSLGLYPGFGQATEEVQKMLHRLFGKEPQHYCPLDGRSDDFGAQDSREEGHKRDAHLAANDAAEVEGGVGYECEDKNGQEPVALEILPELALRTL